MDQMNMNRGMWPSDGSAATGGPAAVAAPPQPYAQPTMQSAAQQLVFTPVAGAGIAAGYWWGREHEHDRGHECG